jgi:hypothetical protein
MRRMGLVVASVVTLLAGACGGSGKARTTDPTLARASSTTTSTTLSYAVPATIDAAYVDRVMKALDHVYGDAIRHLAQVKAMDPYFVDRLKAIYTTSESAAQQQQWSRLQQQNNFGTVRPSAGDPDTTTTRTVMAKQSCVFVEVARNFQPAFTDDETPIPHRYIALVPKDQADNTLNPTPWLMKYDGWKQDGSEPAAPC